ncbi:hypothetical protein RhiirC2_800963 [Rhizophagus irregularis]|uniref:Uncharacterized protein n=1 Tax=Rhizophagus irregularis TaxID=588596 RepID=A0A2N1M307_9GLOM|nr:hypothetical protein RhiirC2_800963 [Rhizophagus irregularis]
MSQIPIDTLIFLILLNLSPSTNFWIGFCLDLLCLDLVALLNFTNDNWTFEQFPNGHISSCAIG